MIYFICMKKNIFYFITVFTVLFSILFSSCATKDNTPEQNNDNPAVEEPAVIPEDTVVPEDTVEVLGEDELTDDEYLRSIAGLEGTAVSKKEFEDDKHEILEIISQLAIIMETKDTLDWLNYIDEPSKEYYKNPVNLRKAQRKLPNKLIELKTIEDYFKYVFIPARKNSHIDEIRYVSKTHVKAVQVREESDAIYYEFKKDNGKWLVYLPPVS